MEVEATCAWGKGMVTICICVPDARAGLDLVPSEAGVAGWLAGWRDRCARFFRFFLYFLIP